MLKGNRTSGRYLVGLCLVVGLPVVVAVLGQRHGAPAPLSTQQQKAYEFPSIELAALDRVVQHRFADVRDTNFGFTRIGVEHRAFQPRSPEEVEAVKRLGSAKTQVLFYVLRNGFERERGSPPSYSGLKGPLYMRAGKVQEKYQYQTTDWQKIPDDAPTYMKIISVAKKVCVDKAAAKGINVPNGRWTISAVPIVASDKACVRCHDTAGRTYSFSSTDLPVRKVKLGDTLGVALYCSMNLE